MNSIKRLPNFFFLFFFFFQLSSGEEISTKGALIIASAEGQVTVINNDTQVALPSDQIVAGGVIYDGHTVKTGPGSKVILLLTNGTIATVKADTSLNIKKFTQEKFDMSNTNLSGLKGEPSKSNTVIDIELGDMVVDVKKLDKDSSFNIESPVGTAGIRGTVPAISVMQMPDGGFQQKTAMLRGEIAFTPRGGGIPTMLGPGQSLASGIGPNGVMLPMQLGQVSAAMMKSIQADVEAAGETMGLSSDAGPDASDANSPSAEEDAPSEDELNDADDERKGASKGLGDDDNGTEEAVALEKVGLIDLDDPEQLSKADTYVEVTTEAADLYQDKQDSEESGRRSSNGKKSSSFLKDLTDNLGDVVEVTEESEALGLKDTSKISGFVESAEQSGDLLVVLGEANEIGAKNADNMEAVFENPDKATNLKKVIHVAKDAFTSDDRRAGHEGEGLSNEGKETMTAMFRTADKANEVAAVVESAEQTKESDADQGEKQVLGVFKVVKSVDQAEQDQKAAEEAAAAAAAEAASKKAAEEAAAAKAAEELAAAQAAGDAAAILAAEAAKETADKKKAAVDDYSSKLDLIEAAADEDAVNELVSAFTDAHEPATIELLISDGFDIETKAVSRRQAIEAEAAAAQKENVFGNLETVTDLAVTAIEVEQQAAAEAADALAAQEQAAADLAAAEAAGDTEAIKRAEYKKAKAEKAKLEAEAKAADTGFDNMIQNADQASELKKMVDKNAEIEAAAQKAKEDADAALELARNSGDAAAIAAAEAEQLKADEAVANKADLGSLLKNADKAKDLVEVVTAAEALSSSDSSTLTALLKNPEGAADLNKGVKKSAAIKAATQDYEQKLRDIEEASSVEVVDQLLNDFLQNNDEEYRTGLDLTALADSRKTVLNATDDAARAAAEAVAAEAALAAAAAAEAADGDDEYMKAMLTVVKLKADRQFEAEKNAEAAAASDAFIPIEIEDLILQTTDKTQLKTWEETGIVGEEDFNSNADNLALLRTLIDNKIEEINSQNVFADPNSFDALVEVAKTTLDKVGDAGLESVLDNPEKAEDLKVLVDQAVAAESAGADSADLLNNVLTNADKATELSEVVTSAADEGVDVTNLLENADQADSLLKAKKAADEVAAQAEADARAQIEAGGGELSDAEIAAQVEAAKKAAKKEVLESVAANAQNAEEVATVLDSAATADAETKAALLRNADQAVAMAKTIKEEESIKAEAAAKAAEEAAAAEAAAQALEEQLTNASAEEQAAIQAEIEAVRLAAEQRRAAEEQFNEDLRTATSPAQVDAALDAYKLILDDGEDVPEAISKFVASRKKNLSLISVAVQVDANKQIAKDIAAQAEQASVSTEFREAAQTVETISELNSLLSDNLPDAIIDTELKAKVFKAKSEVKVRELLAAFEPETINSAVDHWMIVFPKKEEINAELAFNSIDTLAEVAGKTAGEDGSLNIDSLNAVLENVEQVEQLATLIEAEGEGGGASLLDNLAQEDFDFEDALSNSAVTTLTGDKFRNAGLVFNESGEEGSETLSLEGVDGFQLASDRAGDLLFLLDNPSVRIDENDGEDIVGQKQELRNSLLQNIDKLDSLLEINKALAAEDDSTKLDLVLENTASLDEIANISTKLQFDQSKLDAVFSSLENPDLDAEGKAKELSHYSSLVNRYINQPKKLDAVFAINDAADPKLTLGLIDDLSSRLSAEKGQINLLFDNLDYADDLRLIANRFEGEKRDAILADIKDLTISNPNRKEVIFENPSQVASLKELYQIFKFEPSRVEVIFENADKADAFLSVYTDLKDGNFQQLFDDPVGTLENQGLAKLKAEYESKYHSIFDTNKERAAEIAAVASKFKNDPDKLDLVFNNLDKLKDINDFSNEFAGDIERIDIFFANLDYLEDLKILKNEGENFGASGGYILDNLDALNDFKLFSQNDEELMSVAFSSKENLEALSALSTLLERRQIAFSQISESYKTAMDESEAPLESTLSLVELLDLLPGLELRLFENLNQLEEIVLLSDIYSRDPQKLEIVLANSQNIKSLLRSIDFFASSAEDDTYLLRNIDRIEEIVALIDFSAVQQNGGPSADIIWGTLMALPADFPLSILSTDQGYYDLAMLNLRFLTTLYETEVGLENVSSDLALELSELELSFDELKQVLNDLLQGPGVEGPNSQPPSDQGDFFSDTNTLSLLRSYDFSGSIDPSLVLSSDEAFSSSFFLDSAELFEVLSDMGDHYEADADEHADDVSDGYFLGGVLGGKNLSFGSGEYDLSDLGYGSLLVAATEDLSLNGVNGMTFIASSQSAESSSELIFLSSGLMTLEEGSDISYHGEMLGFGSLESIDVINVDLFAEGEISMRSLDSLVINNSEMRTAGNGGADFVHLLAASELSIDNLRFSEQVRQITMEAMTINLSNLNFPAGSSVHLNSLYGGVDGVYPNFGSKQYGRVNFIQNVKYNSNLINSRSSFDQFGGSIHIGSSR